MTKTLATQNQGGRPRSYSPDLVHQIVSDMLENGKTVVDIDAAAVREVDLPGKSGEHQLRNQEVFYGKRKQTYAGVSA
ncbi:hypothetical protein [Pseudooceanicola nitratireducens]|jgi:hypothetical protein|uniref:hypothetical protein n=1 Tax=Pseudooceanicola nitratireducens TaxID=517719 RepID=UPI000B85CC9A|nr:hypothetical protein [Pseudooceanicola nitratireducens]